MARFVTPRGVEVEVSEKAGLAVGYKPVADKATEPAKKTAAKKTTTRKASSSKQD